MSKEVKKNAAAEEEKAEKVITKYDLKVQRRKAEKEKEKRAKDVTTAVSIVILLALAALVLSRFVPILACKRLISRWEMKTSRR